MGIFPPKIPHLKYFVKPLKQVFFNEWKFPRRIINNFDREGKTKVMQKKGKNTCII